MRYCKKCVIPDSRPGVTLDEDGVCMACNTHHNRKNIDWEAREKEFKELVDSVRKPGHGYDCLIPVSGGKDSTWQVVKCLEYGLNPLAATTKVPLRTELGQSNLDNLVSLGVDHIDYQVNPNVEAKFVRQAFERFGSVGLPMHMSMYRMALTLAVKFDIKLVVWGENSSIEYGSSEKEISGYKMDSKWLNKYGVSHGTGPADWVSEELTEKELTPYFGPSDEELDAQGIQAVFLGYYLAWDTYNSLEVAKKHGFSISENGPKIGYYEYADLDDDIISVHHFLKWYKFGFTRAFDNLSIEIRNGRKTREEALEILKGIGDDTPQEDIVSFCKFVGISVEDFFAKCEEFRDPDIWNNEDGVWKIKDFLIPDWNWS
ncbi:MAG: N-acetyl sugar amidotransferase [Bacteroidetes bacterium]|nr:N-acetyl sugar amidotransferase [Bacteroidota bacterium]